MLVRRWFASLLAVSCFSLQDVKNEGCRVLCVRDGYSKGTYSAQKDSCDCIQAMQKYEDLALRKISLGKLERHPISAEDKAMGLVAPFRSTLNKGTIFATTPVSTSSYQDYNDYDE